MKYAVKGLTAWDNVHTGPFERRIDAENWIRGELNRTKNWKSELKFKEICDNTIYEVKQC